MKGNESGVKFSGFLYPLILHMLFVFRSPATEDSIERDRYLIYMCNVTIA